MDRQADEQVQAREDREGLAPTDRVIISGVQRAKTGRKVAATEGKVTAFPSGVSRGETSKLSLPR